MTFAYANQMTEWTLWRRVKRGRSGRVAAVGEFYWRGLTDITALASCTKIKALYLTGNDIADISALASCGELRSLWLGTNRITDISALAGCGKLDTLSLENNEVADISALTGCARLTTLSLQGNRLIEISGLASCRRLGWLYLGDNQITDISALERCTRLQLRIPSRQPPRRGERGGDRETTSSRSNRLSFSTERRWPLHRAAPHRRQLFTAAVVTFPVRGDEGNEKPASPGGRAGVSQARERSGPEGSRRRRSRACPSPQASLLILLYPPKAGDDCQRGRKRRPARGVFRPPLSIIPPPLFPLPSAPSSLAPHRGWGRGMTGLRARESGDISPGVGQFRKTHCSWFADSRAPLMRRLSRQQPSQEGTPPGDGMSDCHDQHEMLGVGIARHDSWRGSERSPLRGWGHTILGRAQ